MRTGCPLALHRFLISLSAFALCLFAVPFSPRLALANVSLTSTYSFQNGSDGSFPVSDLTMFSGYIYGTDAAEQSSEPGDVFEFTAAETTPTFFQLPGGTGANKPYGPVVRGADGNFYGTTYYGGTNGYGTIYRMTPSGDFTTLYSFTDGNDGENPRGVLLKGANGTFFGVTTSGGKYGWGVIYKFTIGGTPDTLYAFTGGSDGGAPLVGLTAGPNNLLYGVCYAGGSATGYSGRGTLFSISKAGKYSLLHTFELATDGGHPTGRLLAEADGTLLGTAYDGGLYGEGTLYEYSTTTGFQKMHDFQGTDGANPMGQLLLVSDGDVYGTTQNGGLLQGVYTTGAGTVFQMSPSGDVTSIYHFTGLGDGLQPDTGLIQSGASQLMGTTTEGGSYEAGTIFRINLNSGPAISGLSPNTVAAGYGAFTLNISGTAFKKTSVVLWNGTPLSTHYVSANGLTASVPSSDDVSSGNAIVVVATPGTSGGLGNGTTYSNPAVLPVTSTLPFEITEEYRDPSGNIVIEFQINNTSSTSFSNLYITAATLGDTASYETFPLYIGNLAANTGLATGVEFPAAAGTTGETELLTLSINYTGGTMAFNKEVILP